MFSDEIFIVYVYALETSCLCLYKESEISEKDRSDFRVPQISYSGSYLFVIAWTGPIFQSMFGAKGPPQLTFI